MKISDKTKIKILEEKLKKAEAIQKVTDQDEKPLVLTEDMEVKNVTVSSWAIICGLSNGKVRTITGVPNHVSNVIDDYLSEVENRGGFNGTTSKGKK
tara:strand:- start:10012 stop:10302 length:291 start_codon:yes stop_codon:yes gene_type:complete